MVNRIAVCMYGQPRTWRYCIPYILQFYNLHGVIVDYFISVKNYQISGEFGDTKIVNLPDDELNDLLAMYNPKKYSIIDSSHECDFNRNDVLHHGNIYYTISDSIMLKQLYEADTGVLYDFVFLQRFDTIVHPVNLVELFFNTPALSYNKNGNTLFYISDNSTVEPIFVAKGINEIWLGGSSCTIDTLGTELMNYTGRLHVDNINVHIMPMFTDPHSLFYRIALKNAIGLEKWENIVTTIHVSSSIVRPNSDLTLDVFDPNTITKHIQYYLQSNYYKKITV